MLNCQAKYHYIITTVLAGGDSIKLVRLEDKAPQKICSVISVYLSRKDHVDEVMMVWLLLTCITYCLLFADRIIYR